MRRRPLALFLVICLSPLSFATSLLARGQVWAFLGYIQVDRRADHGNVQVTRRDCFFRSIRLRVSDAIFFDRLVVHFGNGTSQELVISQRILPEGRNYVIDLTGEPRPLDSIELWYYKEHWESNPKVSFYGIPSGNIAGTDNAQEH